MKMLIASVKAHQFDELMEELLSISVDEIRVFDYKSYSAGNIHKEIFRGQEHAVALVPKVQIQIFADNENLIKADEILKKHTKYDDGTEEKIFVADVKVV